MPLKFVTVNDNVFHSFSLRGNSPPDPYRGSAPGPCWGLLFPRPPCLYSSKISSKIPSITQCWTGSLGGIVVFWACSERRL